MLTAQDYCDFAVALVRERNEVAKAEFCYRQALAVDPTHHEAMKNLAALLVQRRPVESIAWLDISGEQDAFSLLQRGRALIELEKWDMAGDAFRTAYLQTTSPQVQSEALQNSGYLSMVEGSLKGSLSNAVGLLEQACRLNPSNLLCRLDLAFARMSLGKWPEGFGDYEIRTGLYKTLPENGKPIWTGQPLEGKTVMVFYEQGVGDTFQMMRYTRLLKEAGAKVYGCTQPNQDIPLMVLDGHTSRAFALPICAFEGDKLPIEYDYHIASMSLPLRFATTPFTVPAPCACGTWEGKGSKRVGLCWKGNPNHRNDRYRSIHKPDLIENLIRENKDVEFISLQYPADDGVDEMLLHDLVPRLANGWIATACDIERLDLVITVDTAVAHLAGSIGVPTWLLLPAFCDWRWTPSVGEMTTPWYKSARLFRQHTLGDWDTVLSNIDVALKLWRGLCAD